jgi:hypothetical protein
MTAAAVAAPDASVAPGAKPATFPRFIEPCHPTLRQKAPSGAGWIHEITEGALPTRRERRRSSHSARFGPRPSGWIVAKPVVATEPASRPNPARETTEIIEGIVPHGRGRG